MLTVFFAYLMFLISAILTGFFVVNRVEAKPEQELEQYQLLLESESFKRRNLLVQEKIVRANIFLKKMSLEFSLIFPTIDWSVKMSSENFYNEYLIVWNQVGEVQMLADLYVPSIREFVEELNKLTLCYWKCLYKVLVLEEECDRTTPDYLEAVKYSQIVPAKIDNIRQEVEKVIY